MREGWQVNRVADVASVRSGATPSTKEPANWDGEIPWLTPKDLSERPAKYTERGNRSITQQGLKKTALVPAGSVLLTSRAPVGYVSIARNPISTNQGFKSLVLHDGQLPEFWYYLLQNSTQYLLANSGGSTFKEISKKSVENLHFCLPPLHEQKRIVDLMDSVDAAISAAQAEVDAAVELRGDLFDGLLQQFVDELEVRPLGELGEFIRGRRFTKSDYVEDGLGCIHYGQVHTHFGLTASESLTFVPREMKERLRFASTGDVVIAATSEDLDDLGKATVWLGAEDVAVHDDCQIFRHDLDPLFATHLIASHGFHRQKVQYAAGTKVTRISGPNLAKITVQVPQRSRQEEIGRTMASLDAVAEKAQSALDRLRNLRSSMLSILLSGEHEIPETYDQFLDLSEMVQAG